MIYPIEKVHRVDSRDKDLDCLIIFQCKGMLVYHFYATGELLAVDARILQFYTDPMEDYLERFLRELQRSINEAEILAIIHYMQFRLN